MEGEGPLLLQDACAMRSAPEARGAQGLPEPVLDAGLQGSRFCERAARGAFLEGGSGIDAGTTGRSTSSWFRAVPCPFLLSFEPS